MPTVSGTLSLPKNSILVGQVKLAQHAYSCLFGTFLFNTCCERERKSLANPTLSIWPLLLRCTDKFRNPLYNSCLTEVSDAVVTASRCFAFLDIPELPEWNADMHSILAVTQAIHWHYRLSKSVTDLLPDHVETVLPTLIGWWLFVRSMPSVHLYSARVALTTHDGCHGVSCLLCDRR